MWVCESVCDLEAKNILKILDFRYRFSRPTWGQKMINFGDICGQKSPKRISFWSQKLTFFKDFWPFLIFLVFHCFFNIWLSFFSLLYGMSAPSSESQLLEAWPASIYGHLRESADLGVSVIKDFFLFFYLFFKLYVPITRQ